MCEGKGWESYLSSMVVVVVGYRIVGGGSLVILSYEWHRILDLFHLFLVHLRDLRIVCSEGFMLNESLEWNVMLYV